MENRDIDEKAASMLSLRSHLQSSSNTIQLILASQSPRRREILDMIGLQGLYKVQVSPLDESALQQELSTEQQTTDVMKYTQTLAMGKAQAVADQLDSDDSIPKIILASDTVVYFGDNILEKPKSTQEAISMLSQLSGQQHVVHTAVAVLIYSEEGRTCSSLFVDSTVVKFAEISPIDIQAYVESGEPMDKAGSYGIQGMGGQFVECIQGDFFTVMGLPMHRTSKALAKAMQHIIQNEKLRTS